MRHAVPRATKEAIHVHEHRQIFLRSECQGLLKTLLYQKNLPKNWQYHLGSECLKTPIKTFCLTILTNLNVYNIIYFISTCLSVFQGGDCIHLAWARQINGHINVIIIMKHTLQNIIQYLLRKPRAVNFKGFLK